MFNISRTTIRITKLMVWFCVYELRSEKIKNVNWLRQPAITALLNQCKRFRD